jgi:polyphosphate kinase
MLSKIRNAEVAAKNGLSAKIILKMNALTDEALVLALIKAGRAGVEIDLIIRGACILPVNAPGLDGRIRVRSIIGRLLEHSRVYYFKVADVETMWLSSADWMNRNMMRRIEIAWPIVDELNRARILNECCQMSLDDTEDAWILAPNNEYVPVTNVQRGKNQTTHVSAQLQLINHYVNNG